MRRKRYDLAVMGGLVVDGTGLPRRRVDVGIIGGRIATVGQLRADDAERILDATGLVVAPGIVDAHTHYDPQLTFDAYAQTSCFHGVTTVLAGNCGFSAAPCRVEDRPFLTGIFANVEGMDPAALSGIQWGFETYTDYVGFLTGRLGVNMTCYVGHSNLRRWVMGADASERAATQHERDAMVALFQEALEAGAAGLSSSAAPTHLDGDGRPIPSRHADRIELLALASCMRARGTGTITFLVASAIGGIDETDEDLLVEMSRVSSVPVITQGLGARNKVDAPTATWDAAKKFLDRATDAGNPVYSILNVRPFDRQFRLDEHNQHYLAVAAWDSLMRQSHSERMRQLRDEAARAELRHAVENYNRDPKRGTTLPPPLWADLYFHETPTAPKLVGRSVQEIAEALGCSPADALLDVVVADDGATALRWQTYSPAWTRAVADAQQDRRMILGTSDGGAHLSRDDGADWSSFFLRHWVLDERLWTLEEGVRLITAVPASLLGLHDRGVIRPGNAADLMVFDPGEIGPGKKEFTHDLPGGGGRYRANARGVHATIVNGKPVVLEGKLTDELPGAVLSPG